MDITLLPLVYINILGTVFRKSEKEKDLTDEINLIELPEISSVLWVWRSGQKVRRTCDITFPSLKEIADFDYFGRQRATMKKRLFKIVSFQKVKSPRCLVQIQHGSPRQRGDGNSLTLVISSHDRKQSIMGATVSHTFWGCGDGRKAKFWVGSVDSQQDRDTQQSILHSAQEAEFPSQGCAAQIYKWN